MGLQDLPELRIIIEVSAPRLATYNLCGIVDPGQSFVRRHHGCQVGQRTYTVVGALSCVFFLVDC